MDAEISGRRVNAAFLPPAVGAVGRRPHGVKSGAAVCASASRKHGASGGAAQRSSARDGVAAAFVAAAASVALLLPMPSHAAAELSSGKDVFKAQCAACHAGGGNIIPYARGKNLKNAALKKYKYDTVQSIAEITRAGKGAMPKYADKLSDAQIDSVAEYVLEQAKAGWK